MRHSQYNRMRVPRIFYCRESHRGCFPLWRLRTLCFDLDCATIEKKEAAESAGRKTMGKKLRLLFIGNSHTYYNDMPLMAAKKARAAGEAASEGEHNPLKTGAHTKAAHPS